MAFEKKTWLKRLTEYPNRRKLTKTDGTTEIVTVERLEGTVSQEGDAFSEENMNNLEQRIENAITELGVEVIWSRPDYNSGFNAQTVTFSKAITDSDILAIDYFSNTDAAYSYRIWVKLGYCARLEYLMQQSNTAPALRWRTVKISSTSAEFGDAKTLIVTKNSSEATTSNSQVIPWRIVRYPS